MTAAFAVTLRRQISRLRRPVPMGMDCAMVFAHLGRLLALLLLVAGVTSCTSVARKVGVPNTFRVLPGGNPELEARAEQHLRHYVFSSYFDQRKLQFDGDLTIKAVPAVRRDRMGVPFWTDAAHTRDRAGGLTLFTSKKRPVIMVIAVMKDGKWDDRTLKHECCHVILLWNGIDGHPKEFQKLAPLWF